MSNWLESSSLFQRLILDGWQEAIAKETVATVQSQMSTKHRLWDQWMSAMDDLPDPSGVQWNVVDGAIQFCTDDPKHSPEQIKEALMRLHPWRKGPFDFFGVRIDAEWRSDLKWDRMQDMIDWTNKMVVDIGSGNGYFGLRMLAAGAWSVLSIEPTPLTVAQFLLAARYVGMDRHWILPLSDVQLPRQSIERESGRYDVAVSAGVLYHHRGPLDHLRRLAGLLKPGGVAIVETIVVDGDEQTCLFPRDRYAQMRNVWMIPSVALLKLWLLRTGWTDVEVVDVSPTLDSEQRSTDWMTFQSLADFLDPSDRSKTVEGYPAPQRAIFKAIRRE